MEVPKTPTTSRSLSPEKTAAILDGALQVFLEQGYVGTTMDRIASAAGVSKPTVYNHFCDKESLFNALIEQWVKKINWMTCPEQLLERSDEPPETVLRQLANDIFNTCIDHPEKVNFIRVVFGESGRFPELGRAFVAHMDKPMLDALTQYLSACPGLNLPDPAATATIFLGAIVFRLITHEMLHSGDILPMERDRLIDGLIHLILRV